MKKSKDIFDILKIVLSVFVVGIHAEMFVTILNPLFRMAVPLFFITSSYFFFGKLQYVKGLNERRNCLKKFIKRNLTLYMFWFLVLMPITIYIRGWYNKPIIEICVDIIKRLLFNSTFRASWYIIALTIGVSIVFFISKRLTNNAIIFIGGIIYIICVLTSNYYGVIEDNVVFVKGYEWYISHFMSLINSWPVSLLWIALGKKIAEKNTNYNMKLLVAIASVSFVSLYCEQYFIYNAGISKANDCYFSLVPLCFSIFLMIKDLDVSCRNARIYRKLSTIIYTSHASIITVLSPVLTMLGLNNNLLLFVFTITIGVLLCISIGVLENKKYFRWLKYSY